ncbi:MAG: AAA family ATPase [bacterium]
MAEFEKLKRKFDDIFEEMGKVIVGQREIIEQILIAILCDANALLESYPGLGKTLTIRTLAEVLDLDFSRIQNTPDLMPSDVTGTYIIEEGSGGKRTFKFQKGPIFSNIVLADEINRATPKTQSALLEAMQEKQVTIGNETHILDKPFFILATQNPVEQEGTFNLPEAQQDRFLLKIMLDYPDFNDEMQIIERYTKPINVPNLKKIVNKQSIVVLQKFTRQVPIAKDLSEYAVKIVNLTRNTKDLIEYGASPRASIGLILASKARALIRGRAHVSEQDIKIMALPILRHRIILNFESERKGMTPDDVIKEILKKAK